MMVGDWAWMIIESSIHSPYKGLWAMDIPGNSSYVCVIEQFNAETPWPIAQLPYHRVE